MRAPWLLLALVGCGSSERPPGPIASPAVEAAVPPVADAPTPPPGEVAVLRVTRTLVFDDHAAGQAAPDADLATGALTLPYAERPAATRPVIRTYSARIAVPRDGRRSWHLFLGDDYEVLIEASGLGAATDGLVPLRYQIKSNYRIALPGKAPVGPNAFAFESIRTGGQTAWQVANDATRDTLFYEFDQTLLEAVTTTTPADVAAGVDESEAAQQARWRDWPAISKAGLR